MSDKKFTAITLDTSIFDGNGIRLDRGLLGRLTQFKSSPVKFILSDIMVNEIVNHLGNKILSSRTTFEKALNDANDFLSFDGGEINDIKSKLIHSDKVKESAEKRVKEFLEKTGAEVIDSGDYVNVSDLRDKYFNNEAPFSETGNKKNEFPDAIALMGLEGWAEDNDELIYAVSTDNDWKAFCENANYIVFHDNLSEALDYFNRVHSPFDAVNALEKFLANGNAPNFMRQLHCQLESFFDDIYVDQDADSGFYWEGEGTTTSFQDFMILNDNFQVVETDENTLVLEAFLSVDLSIDGDFSLSVFDSIDRDQVSMGSISRTVEETFETRVLITVVGDFDKAKESPDDLEIESIEVLDKPDSIHFGYLELDYEPDYE